MTRTELEMRILARALRAELQRQEIYLIEKRREQGDMWGFTWPENVKVTKQPFKPIYKGE